MGSKTCSETNVAIEGPRRMLVELMADEEARVKIRLIEEVEYMVDKFGEEDV